MQSGGPPHFATNQAPAQIHMPMIQTQPNMVRMVPPQNKSQQQQIAPIGARAKNPSTIQNQVPPQIQTQPPGLQLMMDPTTGQCFYMQTAIPPQNLQQQQHHNHQIQQHHQHAHPPAVQQIQGADGQIYLVPQGAQMMPPPQNTTTSIPQTQQIINPAGPQCTSSD